MDELKVFQYGTNKYCDCSVKCCAFSSFSKFMLREFETRRPQFEQLTQSAEGILSQTGNSAEDLQDLVEVQAELGSISQQWEDLTQRLSQRSNHIDQAQGTSERFQVPQVPVDPSNSFAFKHLCLGQDEAVNIRQNYYLFIIILPQKNVFN